MSEQFAELHSDLRALLSEEQYRTVVAFYTDHRTRRATRELERLPGKFDRQATVLEKILELDSVQIQHVRETQSVLILQWEGLYSAIREDEVSVADAVYTRIQLHQSFEESIREILGDDQLQRWELLSRILPGSGRLRHILV